MKRINSRSVDFIWDDNDSSIEIERKKLHVKAHRMVCSDDWQILIYNIDNEDTFLYNKIIENTSDYQIREIIMMELKRLLCKAQKH